MRFDQVDLLVMLSRGLGGLMIAGGVLGALFMFVTGGQKAGPDVAMWLSIALAGLWLVNFCTGVLAQIETVRATQDSLQELRAIKDALKGQSV